MLITTVRTPKMEKVLLVIRMLIFDVITTEKRQINPITIMLGIAPSSGLIVCSDNV